MSPSRNAGLDCRLSTFFPDPAIASYGQEVSRAKLSLNARERKPGRVGLQRKFIGDLHCAYFWS